MMDDMTFIVQYYLKQRCYHVGRPVARLSVLVDRTGLSGLFTCLRHIGPHFDIIFVLLTVALLLRSSYPWLLSLDVCIVSFQFFIGLPYYSDI